MKIRSLFRCFVLITASLVSATVAQAADADEAPVPIKAVAPEYPLTMKRQGVSGIVMVRVVVDENGEVAEHAVSKSTREEFETAALEAVAKWKFKPARKDGVAVKANITLPIKFVVEG
jgi:periplasmic protein TonB